MFLLFSFTLLRRCLSIKFRTQMSFVRYISKYEQFKKPSTYTGRFEAKPEDDCQFYVPSYIRKVHLMFEKKTILSYRQNHSDLIFSYYRKQVHERFRSKITPLLSSTLRRKFFISHYHIESPSDLIL